MTNSNTHWLDIDYVGDGHTGHLLDIHLPNSNQSSFPIVICIYGSAWFSNSKKNDVFNEGIGHHLLKSGFAVVAINHRSSKDALFPAQLHDVKAAIRFIRANANQYRLDNAFIGITGWSSGGHLSALAGTTNHLKSFKHKDNIDIEGHIGKYTQTSSHVNAVVDWFGPTHFLTMDECGSEINHNDIKSPESSLIGGPIQELPERCALANPATYIQNNNPPFLIIHGDKDPLVPYCQSDYLHQQLKNATIDSQLITVKDGGHGPGVMIDTYYETMINFFKTKL